MIATTDDPRWYVRRLVLIEAPFQVVAADELRDAATELAELLEVAAAPAQAAAPQDVARA